MPKFDHIVLDHNSAAHQRRPEPACPMCAFDQREACEKRARADIVKAARAWRCSLADEQQQFEDELAATVDRLEALMLAMPTLAPTAASSETDQSHPTTPPANATS